MNGQFIAVDSSLEIAPYQQIEEQIRAAIQRGDLGPKALLPTVRQLADDLNVAPNTVARAYANLAESGWLISEGRRGTRIADRIPTTDKRIRATVLRDSLDRVISSLLARGYNATEILSEVQRLVES